MSFLTRLATSGQTREAPTGAVRAPQYATQAVNYTSPGMPQYDDWDADTAIRVGYYGYIYSYRCARTIATTIAGLAFRAGPDLESPGTTTPGSRLAKLLGPPPGGPTSNVSARQLWTWTIVQYLITGRWAWETEQTVSGQGVAGLWPLPVKWLKPVPSDKPGEWFESFQFTPPARDVRTLTPQQCFYAWRPSQNDWRQAESMLQALSLPLQVGVAMERYLAAFVRNNMVGSKLIITPEFAEPNEQRAFEEQFLSTLTGFDNAGRTAFAQWEDTEGTGKQPSIQVVDLATKPVDAQIIELLNWVRDTVCVAWGVPVSILGIAADRTYENADQEHRNYWTGTILGIIAELQDLVNIGLAPRLGNDVGWFDLSKVEALKPAQRFMPEAPSNLVTAGIVAAGEVREDLGLPAEIPANVSAEVDPVPAIEDTPGSTTGSTTGGSGGARAATESVPAAKVRAYLAENYPPGVLDWVTDATWTRRTVPLADIKFARRPGGREDEKTKAIASAVQAGKMMDPVVLVDTGEDKLEIADGYHRTLAFDRAGKTTIEAYVGTGAGQHGPWEKAMHDAKLNRAAADFDEFVDALGDELSGERYDTSPLGTGKNWVTDVGGLPLFIRAIAHALIRSGRSESQAIQLAVGVVRRWASGGGKVTAKTRAKAAAALAEWEAKKGAAHGHRAVVVASALPGLTESGTSGSLIPAAPTRVVGQTLDAPHLFVPVKGSRRCALCNRGMLAAAHMTALAAMPKVRAAQQRAATPVIDRAAHWTAVDSQATALEGSLAESLRGLFAQQQKATLDRLMGRRGQQMVRAAQQPPDDETVADEPPTQVNAGQVFDLAHWVAQTEQVVAPTMAAVTGTTDGWMRSHLHLVDDEAGQGSAAVRSALASRAKALAAQVSQTTADQLTKALGEGVAAGEHIPQLAERVKGVFVQAGSNRATTIARTEVIGAMNQAAHTYAAALPSTVVASKEWLATPDSRTRESHRVVNRQTRSLQMPFDVGGHTAMYPGDPTLPPDECINCRCTTLYIPTRSGKPAAAEQPVQVAA